MLMYLPHQERLDNEILNAVLDERERADFEHYSANDVKTALKKSFLDLEDFKALLSPAAAPLLEDMMWAAKAAKERYFGKNIYLFTPLYISNHCENLCVYCGFHSRNNIRRAQLDDDGIIKELESIASAGFEELLMLTGEAPAFSSTDYIANACRLASERFATLGIEVYPLSVENYAKMHENGSDYVTVFQETYNPRRYAQLHLEGDKTAFGYRFEAQERALKAGMRGVAFGALFGLDMWRQDALSVGLHASLLQKRYQDAEISISVPRLRPIINNSKISPKDVRERELAQIICAYRLFLPFANITLSTRESVKFRDNAVKFGVSKVSAGVKVGIGEHGDDKAGQGDGQFEISDSRDGEQMRAMLRLNGLVPVESEHVFLG